MQISMFMGRVRFVCDSKGPLETKPQRVAITLAREHNEAILCVRSHFVEAELAGVVIEYDTPIELSDTTSFESLVFVRCAFTT